MNRPVNFSMWTLFGFVVLMITIVSIQGLQSNFDLRSRASFNSNTSDVIVVGAGTGGIAAALQAARQGSTVLLLEETDWIGGQMTAAGVTSIDGGDPRWTGGIFEEFRKKIAAHYQAKGKSIGTCYWSSATTCFEPSVGQSILKQMIHDASNISLRLRTRVTKINKTGNVISGMIVNQNGNSVELKAKVVIDATEYGDIIELSGAGYRVGNGVNGNIPSNACIQDITYLSVMKKYPNGVPTELKFTAPPPGYTAAVKDTFSKTVSNNGSNSFPISYPVSWNFHNAYRGMPDSSNPLNYTGEMNEKISKTGINWANDYPLNAYVNPEDTITLSTRYLEDRAYRKEINCEAKLRTIQFMYYVQNELGKSEWAIANDEGYNSPYNREENSCNNIPAQFKAIEQNMPVMPYIRESRRGIGTVTVTASDIKRIGSPVKAAKSFESSIAIGDYINDLHNCYSDSNLELALEKKSDVGIGPGPFQLPVESLISKDVPNLLFAEKNLSISRLVNGASRLQPITMVTGQAAGSLAALAIKKAISPSSVRTIELQRNLLQSGAMLAPFTDVTFQTPKLFEIQQIVLRNIMIGYGNLVFGVSDILTRKQISSVITKAFRLPIVKPTRPTFNDVPISDVFYPMIESIYASGITSGCSVNPKKYCPEDSVSNGQIAVFALRGWQKLNPGIKTISPPKSTYSDVPVTYYAYSFIETLAANGVTWYCDESTKKFCPEAPITRSQASYIISTILAKHDGLQ